MRTRKSTVIFRKPFVLNRDVGALPAGSYEIEIDEEELGTVDQVAYRRTGVYLYVRQGATIRMIVATPAEVDSALERDRHVGEGTNS